MPNKWSDVQMNIMSCAMRHSRLKVIVIASQHMLNVWIWIVYASYVYMWHWVANVTYVSMSIWSGHGSYVTIWNCVAYILTSVTSPRLLSLRVLAYPTCKSVIFIVGIDRQHMTKFIDCFRCFAIFPCACVLVSLCKLSLHLYVYVDCVYAFLLDMDVSLSLECHCLNYVKNSHLFKVLG